MNLTLWVTVASLFTLTLGQVFETQVQVFANTPTNVKQCSSTLLTWSSGESPYNVRVNAYLTNGGVGEKLQEWQTLETTSVQWQVNVTAGINAVLSVTDVKGFVGMSGGFDILPGTADCMAFNEVPSPSTPPSPPSPPNRSPPLPTLNNPLSSNSPPSNPSPNPNSNPPPPLSPPTPSLPPISPTSLSLSQSSLSFSPTISSDPISRAGSPSTLLPSYSNSASSPPTPTGLGGSTPHSDSSATRSAVITTVVTLPCFIILGFGFVCWRRRRRRRRQQRPDVENRSADLVLPNSAMEQHLISHHSSLISVSSHGQSSTPTAEFTFIPLAHAVAVPNATYEFQEGSNATIARGASLAVASSSRAQNHETGVFSQDPRDPEIIRLGPDARHAQIAARYQAKLQREMGLDGQPSTLSSPPRSLSASPSATVSDPHMRALVEEMRTEIERLRAQQDQQQTAARVQSPPPPSYNER